jgi:WS/DGAT/MGAT family acyltransferase
VSVHAPAAEPLSPADLEILRTESPTVAGHSLKVVIVGHSEGRATPDVEELRAHIAERVERAPRLRRKLRMRGRRSAEWVADDAFDVRQHVLATRVAEPVSFAELRSRCARAMEERLDRSRPLWRIEVLGPLEESGVAVLWKIHHCIADGVTAMALAREVLWDAAGGEHEVSRGDGATTHIAGLREALDLRRPHRLPGALRRQLHRTRHSSPFDGRVGSSRAVAHVSVPLGEVKTAAKALVPGATVNDAVLALVTGGLRRWYETRGAAAETLRVKVPVSLHHRGESAENANRDSFFCVSLPLAEPDSVERLRRINTETALRKRSGDPLVFDTFLGDIGRVAPPVRRGLERLTLHPRAFAFNVSNVVGPAERPTMLGAPVRALYSFADIRERHGLRVAVVSMADELHFGLCADPTIVGDLDPLTRGISAEASTLRQRIA